MLRLRYLSISVSLCLCLLVSLCLCLSVSLYLCIIFSLSLCPSVSLSSCISVSAHLCVSVSLCLYLTLSVFLCLRLSVSLFLCLIFLCPCLHLTLSLSVQTTISIKEDAQNFQLCCYWLFKTKFSIFWQKLKFEKKSNKLIHFQLAGYSQRLLRKTYGKNLMTKNISHKHSALRQHLSQLKASAFFSLQKN
jgi:hypothetical protein